MARTPKEIENLYNKIAEKKKKEGIKYYKKDFLADLGLSKLSVFSDWTSEPQRSKPTLQSEILMDYLEKDQLT